jgi:hypothetical protein
MAVADDLNLKVARGKGEFLWHRHADEAEFFLPRMGRLVIRDGADAGLGEGDLRVLPHAVEQTTAASEECSVVVVEPVSTKHTGDSGHAITTRIEPQLAPWRAPNQPTGQQETPAQWPSKS